MSKLIHNVRGALNTIQYKQAETASNENRGPVAWIQSTTKPDQHY